MVTVTTKEEKLLEEIRCLKGYINQHSFAVSNSMNFCAVEIDAPLSTRNRFLLVQGMEHYA